MPLGTIGGSDGSDDFVATPMPAEFNCHPPGYKGGPGVYDGRPGVYNKLGKDVFDEFARTPSPNAVPERFKESGNIPAPSGQPDQF